ncbi:hypothetical protein HAX54_037841, partial [Datura stramonium]|nr:hypothetical protein [Datura stramonium]
MVLDLSSNYLGGSLPPKLGNLKAMSQMDLSMNQFSNGIPREIGGLRNLVHLSMRHNKLQGSIPELISNIIDFEFLDLSYNNISRTIPMSLEKLNTSSISMFLSTSCMGKSPQGVLSRTLKYRRGKRDSQEAASLSIPTTERISYYELLQPTDALSKNNLISSRSFGSTYKDVLRSGTPIAVKVFYLQLEGAFKSFNTECEVLHNLLHRNLVKVITSCSNLDFK